MAMILSVDDSPSMRALVTAALQQAGHTVVTAADGKQALAVARQKKIDLVLMDLNMPNMDGITLVKEMRTLDGYQFVPMLMLTTEMSADRKQQAKSAGATGWLVKPFDPPKLVTTVSKLVAR